MNRERTGGARLWVELRAGYQLACRLQPILRKSRLKRHNGRSHEPDLDISPMGRIVRVSLPLIRDTGAPGKANPAVHDQRLAMGTVIETRNGIPAHRVVPRELASARFKEFQDFLAD